MRGPILQFPGAPPPQGRGTSGHFKPSAGGLVCVMIWDPSAGGPICHGAKWPALVHRPAAFIRQTINGPVYQFVLGRLGLLERPMSGGT